MRNLLRMSVEDYLSGSHAIESLQVRLAEITWGEVTADEETTTLANSAENFIAEFTGGHITEVELRAALTELFKVTSLLISSGDFSSAVVTRSSSQSLTQRVAFG